MLASSEIVARYKLVRRAAMIAVVAPFALLAACSSQPPPPQPAPEPVEAAPPPAPAPAPAPTPVPPARG